MSFGVPVGFFKIVCLILFLGRISTSYPIYHKQRNPGLCHLDCSSKKTRPVCGTDGVTYQTRCDLDRASCRQKQTIQFKHKGECFSENKKCFEDRRDAIASSIESAIHVPKCKEDGSFKEIQCHDKTGYCWCVDRKGKPILGSSVRDKRPNCRNKNGKRRNRRGKKNKKKHTRKSCSQGDRLQFNNFVVEAIVSSYKKLLGDTQSDSKDLVNRRFHEMDTNGDGVLKRKEFGNFRKAIKRSTKLKYCATTFWKHCDKNNDRVLTPREWITCLTVDVNVSFQLFLSLNPDKSSGSRRKDEERDESNNGQQDMKNIGLKEENPDFQFHSLTSNIDINDCRERNILANEALKNGDKTTYIPECNTDGKYKRIQCHESTGHCWCADENTGIPIIGTSVENQAPNCSDEVLSAKRGSQIEERQWRKCPEPHKTEFLKNLMTLFKRSYLIEGYKRESDASKLDKEVVRWKFRMLDSNGDGVLTKRELKPLRKKVLKDFRLKRCGRRLPLHCDIDENRQISKEEWGFCLGILKGSHFSRSSIHLNPGKSRGVNPFKKYLIWD